MAKKKDRKQENEAREARLKAPAEPEPRLKAKP